MTDITLAILAGGAGSRMGKPKGELRIGGQPILAYQLRQIAWDGPTMLVTAPGREHPPAWERFDREVVDSIGGQGPLRGIWTALENATTPTIVIATADMPGVRNEQLRWVVAELSAREASLGVMMQRGAQVEPFPSAFHVGAKRLIERDLWDGRRAVRELCRRAEFPTVDAPREWDPHVWTNLNRPEDVLAFAVRVAQRGPVSGGL